MASASTLTSACPFSPDGQPEQTRVIVPASRFWVLQDFLPTGEVRPVDARLDFRTGQPRSGLKLDDVLTDLEYKDRALHLPAVDLEQEVGVPARIRPRLPRTCLVYSPIASGCHLPGAIHADDRRDQPSGQGNSAGLRVLEHGAQDTLRHHDGNRGCRKNQVSACTGYVRIWQPQPPVVRDKVSPTKVTRPGMAIIPYREREIWQVRSIRSDSRPEPKSMALA